MEKSSCSFTEAFALRTQSALFLYYNCMGFTHLLFYSLCPNYVLLSQTKGLEAFLKTRSQLSKKPGSDFVPPQVSVVISLYGLFRELIGHSS